MTKSKNTKRALLMSVLSMMLCIAMLAGSTFAWFTDSVTSGKNRIVAGNLDVEMEYKTPGMTTYKNVKELSGTEHDLFFRDVNGEVIKWEPGVMAYTYFKVKNVGSLALKYALSSVADDYNTFTTNGVEHNLSEVIKFAVFDEEVALTGRDDERLNGKKFNGFEEFIKMGNLLPTSKDTEEEIVSEDTFTVVAYWEPNVNDIDNLYNVNNGWKTDDDADQLYINIEIELFATQTPYEKDSFGPDYDANAEYPVVLPAGVTTETFETAKAVAYAGGTYYDTLKSAVEATEGVIYLKPDSELTETMTHAHVRGDLTIYGNGAALVGGGEHDLEVDTYNDAQHPGLVGDVTINIYDFDGIAVWGQRTTEYTVNINLYNCHEINRVYISGAKGTNNITFTNCSAGYSQDGKFVCKLYSNAKGEIRVTNCNFDRVCEPINLNNKSTGVQNIYVTDCTFTNCSTSDITVTDSGWAAPVRVVAAGKGAVSNLYLKGNEFVYTEGKEAVNGRNVLTEELREDKKGEIKGTVNVIED